jgi:ATP-dependent DNA helicase RecG
VEGIVIAGVTEDLIQQSESQRLAFASAGAELHKVAATVCAFLNSRGGTLIVGVDERGKIESVKNAANVAADVAKYLQTSVHPKTLWSVNTDSTSQGDVITIEVPEGSERPYVSGGSIFVRRGAATVPADPDTIRKLVQQQYAQPTPWERLPAPGLELTDLDEDEIRRTVQVAMTKRNYTFPQPGDLSAVLQQLALMSAGQLTNGADVLFSENPARRLPQTRIRATLFATDKGGEFVDNRIFEGNAFLLLDQVSAFVNQHVRIAAEFKARKMTRDDRPQYPFAALREGLINAIIHRDYSAFAGGMSVSIYPDRIQIWNTGKLPEGLKISDLKKENHPSVPVNPDMVHVFYLREIIERVGRGTYKIVLECKAAGLRSPQWEESPSGITLTLFGQSKKKPRLNQRQRDLLARLAPGDELKPGDYYDEMKSVVSQRQAQRDLTDLESSGWLRKEGEGPATVYFRTDQANDSIQT